MELANAIYYVIVFIVFIIIVSAILTRLRKIINTTYKNHSNPVVRHYAEARIFELTGDNTEALREYYRAYMAMKFLKFRWVTTKSGMITPKVLEEKIEHLGGDPPGLIMKQEKKPVD